MTINHNVPSTVRRPGNFHEFDFFSATQGLTPLENRVLLVGTRNTGEGTATNDLFVQVTSDTEADALFGIGSEVALMVRKALKIGRLIGFAPQIWAMPIAEASGGTKAVHTITVGAGTAAVGGDVIFRIGEQLFRAGVTAGDNQDAVAASIKLAVDGKLATVPVTPTVALGVVTLTNKALSINGSDVKVEILSVGLTGLSITPVLATPGVGSPDITDALSASIAKYFECVAIANHLAADVTILKSHLDSAWGPDQKRWRFGFVGENGSLATCTGLSIAANDERMSFGSYEGSPSWPGLIAAEEATIVAARSQPNYNWNGHVSTLIPPSDESLVYTGDEKEVALAAGVTAFVPNDARDGSHVVRLVTSKTQDSGNPFERLLDLGIIRGMVAVHRQLDAAFSQKFGNVNKSAAILKRQRSVAYAILLAFEKIGVTQNVEANFSQLLVEADPLATTRSVTSIPEDIIPILNQSILKGVLYTN